MKAELRIRGGRVLLPRAGSREIEPMLFTTLESGFHVATVQHAPGRWKTLVLKPLGFGMQRIEGMRDALTEEAARADFAALCGEFGP